MLPANIDCYLDYLYRFVLDYPVPIFIPIIFLGLVFIVNIFKTELCNGFYNVVTNITNFISPIIYHIISMCRYTYTILCYVLLILSVIFFVISTALVIMTMLLILKEFIITTPTSMYNDLDMVLFANKFAEFINVGILS